MEFKITKKVFTKGNCYCPSPTVKEGTAQCQLCNGLEPTIIIAKSKRERKVK